jgi:hypothetical protein
MAVDALDEPDGEDDDGDGTVLFWTIVKLKFLRFDGSVTGSIV